MAVTIIREVEQYRLIADDQNRYAVIESRNGKVFSLHCHHRLEADDTAAGMEVVVCDGWQEKELAVQRFQEMIGEEERLSEIIW
jgi:hypothetical protein